MMIGVDDRENIGFLCLWLNKAIVMRVRMVLLFERCFGELHHFVYGNFNADLVLCSGLGCVLAFVLRVDLIK